MAYNKHTWTTQELITADKLNNIEDGVYDNSNNIDNIVNIDDSNLVHKTGNETIAGNKTFSGNTTLGGTLMTDSGWKNMSLAGGVTVTIARYRLLNGVVYIHVLDVNTDVGKVFATLPDGYRPSNWVWTTWYAGGKSGNFLITSNGDISRASSTVSGTDSGTKASFEVSYPIN